MVERVARAIMEAREGSACLVEDWKAEERDNPHVAKALRQARAAIDAMQDTGPSFSDSGLPFAMIDAGMTLLEKASDDLAGRNGDDVPDWDYGMEAVAVYRVMIDAAQSEPS